MSNTYKVGDLVELTRSMPVWENTWEKGTTCKIVEIVRPGVFYVERHFETNSTRPQVKVADFEIESH